MFDWLQKNQSIKLVVLSMSFRGMLDQNNLVEIDGGRVERASPALAGRYLEQTISAISRLGLKVVIISPPPNNGSNLGGCLFKALRFGGDIFACNFELSNSTELSLRTIDLLSSLNRGDNIVWLDKVICPEGRCRASVDGVLLYRDNAHLSHEGSTWVGRQLKLDEFIH